jgi:hypothetical protein
MGFGLDTELLFLEGRRVLAKSSFVLECRRVLLEGRDSPSPSPSPEEAFGSLFELRLVGLDEFRRVALDDRRRGFSEGGAMLSISLGSGTSHASTFATLEERRRERLPRCWNKKEHFRKLEGVCAYYIIMKGI